MTRTRGPARPLRLRGRGLLALAVAATLPPSGACSQSYDLGRSGDLVVSERLRILAHGRALADGASPIARTLSLKADMIAQGFYHESGIGWVRTEHRSVRRWAGRRTSTAGWPARASRSVGAGSRSIPPMLPDPAPRPGSSSRARHVSPGDPGGFSRSRRMAPSRAPGKAVTSGATGGFSYAAATTCWAGAFSTSASPSARAIAASVSTSSARPPSSSPGSLPLRTAIMRSAST